MKLRMMLLAGTVLPFAMSFPAAALERPAGSLILLAQNDAGACPEGQQCPPPEQAAPAPEPQAAPQQAEEPAKKHKKEQAEQPPPEPAPQQEAAPAPEPQAAPQQSEEPPKKRHKKDQAEQPPPEPAQQQAAPAPQQQQAAPAPEPAPQQQQAAPAPEPQAAPQQAEGPPKKRHKKDQAEQPPAGPAPQQPAEAAPQQPPAGPPPADQATTPPAQPPAGQAANPPAQPPPAGQSNPPAQPAAEQAANPPAADQPTVVEQQLEAQGDKKEAKKVRSLREQLLDQLQQAIGGEPPPPPRDQGRPGRDRDHRYGDRNRPPGPDDEATWYDRDPDRGNEVERRDGRVIVDLGNGDYYVKPVVPDEGDRLLYGADDVEVQNLPRGRTRTIVHRPHGVDIVTVRDRFGDIVTRSRMLPGGREIVLIDNRYADDGASAPPPPPILLDVPPPRVRIPQNRYIVDLGTADDDVIRGALLAPTVAPPPRRYTLDEVLRNEQVRAYSPRIDLDTITFPFGSSTIGNDQMGAIYNLGKVMQQVIADNPDEVYLIEGHTDAVGSDYDNLILSDQRAEAVATALSQNFNIPPENLVTEGYGERFLKIPTQDPEQQNRRATIRRVTELLQAQKQ